MPHNLLVSVSHLYECSLLMLHRLFLLLFLYHSVSEDTFLLHNKPTKLYDLTQNFLQLLVEKNPFSPPNIQSQ